MESSLKRDLISYARSLGFARVGITSADPLLQDEQFLKNWLAGGRAGEMGYLTRGPERRGRPAELLPGAKSVIALALNYNPERGSEGVREGGKERVDQSFTRSLLRSSEGHVARYAWGPDYHKVINKRLESLVRYLESLSPGNEFRTFVDTGPLLERALARRAGLGFMGKNTMLITKGLGSWVFLANVITTLDLPKDSADERSCGQCRLCIDACPTEAITAPFELDARCCIAYLTIEKDGPIDPKLREKTGGWVFGCDICQDVCPHNALHRGSDPVLMHSVAVRGADASKLDLTPAVMHEERELGLAQLLDIRTETEFQELFGGTAMMRAGRNSLIRNACLAAANLGRTDLIGRLQDLSRNDSSPIVREHAAWALEKLGAGPVSDVPPASTQNLARS